MLQKSQKGSKKKSPLLRELKERQWSLRSKRARRPPKGVYVPKGASGAPEKNLRSRRARRASKGVSAPKGARGAPLESQPLREPEGLQKESPLLRELEELQGSLRSKKARMASK